MPTQTIDRDRAALAAVLHADRLRSLPDHPLERVFQAAVRKYAAARGWRVFATWSSRHSPAGEPDLRLVRERVVWAELKTATGRVSGLQQRAIEALKAAGAEVYVWRPGDIKEIVRLLR